MNGLTRTNLTTGVGVAVLMMSLGGSAQNAPSDELKALRERVEELEAKVKQLEKQQNSPPQTNNPVVERRLEALDEKVQVLQQDQQRTAQSTEGKLKALPTISLGSDGFAFRSADTNFGVALKGVLQVDSRTFFNDGGIVGNDTIGIRRARPILQGTVFRDFDFLFVPDFAPATPQIFDAFINYRFAPWLQLQAGKFKVPVGLEELQPDAYTWFNERALPTQLSPNRDVGFELHGDVFANRLSYAVGIFNGVGDNRNSSNVDFEDDKEFAGRIFFQPFRQSETLFLQGLGFGVAGSYGSMQQTNVTGLPATIGGTLPGYATDGQEQFFAYNPVSTTTNRASVVADGEHWRLSPQGYYFYGPVGVMGEYVISNQRVSRAGSSPATARLENAGWQVSGSWVLTGEDAGYAGAVIPRHAFNPLEGGWGAWQLAARYAELDIDRTAFPLFSDPSTSAHSADTWSVGLNWYLNRNVMMKTSFSHTAFHGGGASSSTTPPGIVTRKDENVLFTRMQLAF